jgi:hypothetical protein
MRRTHTQGICLNAGGVTAFYPTQIPYHHKSTFMKSPADDPFGRIVEGCRKLNMVVVARTDSHSCLDDAAVAHPEWLNIDETGKPRRHMTMPETRLITCALGPYNFDFMTQVHREIVTKYRVEGIFCNRWQAGARGMCYCESCQKLYRAATGLDLPRGTSPQEAARYNAWVEVRLEELWRLWDRECQAINPKFRYFTNTGISIEKMNELAPTALVEQQARGQAQPWAMGTAAKQRRTAFGNKTLISIAGITSGARQSVTTEAEARIWVTEGIANGLRPWVLKTSGVNPDKRWVAAYEKVYDWHWRAEKYMKNIEPLARVAVVTAGGGEGGGGAAGGRGGAAAATGPGRGGRAGGGAPPAGGGAPGGPATGNASAGMYQALVEGRIPFELVGDGQLSDAAKVDRFKLLILPNLTSLSDTQCEALRQFVGRGGSLLATFQTSLFTGGSQRPNFGLADLFGVAYAGQVESGGGNSYMRVESATQHPILAGLEGVEQILNVSQHTLVRPVAAFSNPPLTRIPTFPTLPMEEIFPRERKTDIPEVYLRDAGPRSRIVYFPGDIDSTFATGMESDHALLLRNAVNWAMREAQPVTVTGPGILDVTVWRQTSSMTVHLVNLTNPYMLRAAYREPVPIGAQRVSVAVPQETPVKSVKLLIGGQTVQFTQAAGRVNLTVPSISFNEVVAIDF